MKHTNILITIGAFVFSLTFFSCTIPQIGEKSTQEQEKDTSGMAIINQTGNSPGTCLISNGETQHAQNIPDAQNIQPLKVSKRTKAKTFGWGFLFGIIATLLCINFQKVKKIVKKIMSVFNNSELDKENSKSPMNSDVSTCEDNNTNKSTDLHQGKEDSIHQEEKLIEEGQISQREENENKQEEQQEEQKEKIQLSPFSFAVENDAWSVVGSSVIGKSHISMNLPCQDCCKYKYLGNGWGIAITSDGAGSAKHSEVGSQIVVERGLLHFEQLIESQGWKKREELPSDVMWQKMAYSTLYTIYKEIVAFGQTRKIDYKDLSATIIVLIHTPLGILCTHIGDGRAGYRTNLGEWKSLFTPHKGEEANQTIFITSDFWTQPNYIMSDVFVPQSVVVKESITAFTLMSDGCEHTMWECNHFDDEKNRYYDPNRPFAKLYESLCDTLKLYTQEHLELNLRAENWQRFITDGNNSFKKESDDKTLILGILCK